MRHKGINYAKYGYIFAAPFVLTFLIFSLYPMIYTAVIGFTNMRGQIQAAPVALLENPFENFQKILVDPLFQKAVVNTFKMWTINFIPQITLALLLTAWFTSRRNKVRGQGFFKVIFYMPNIITAATIAILFQVLFLFPNGPVNSLLDNAGLINAQINFLQNKAMSQNIVAFIQFWMWYGYTMLILTSGVLGMSTEMFEAADIDGANGVQIFFQITIPNLRTILLYTLVTSLIGGLNMFDIPRLFNNGNPDNATRTVSMFIYDQAFAGSYLYNRASAASMVLFAIVTMLSIVIFFALRDKDAIMQKKVEKRAKRAAKEAAK